MIRESERRHSKTKDEQVKGLSADSNRTTEEATIRDLVENWARAVRINNLNTLRKTPRRPESTFGTDACPNISRVLARPR
jgi:hypothetical protein